MKTPYELRFASQELRVAGTENQPRVMQGHAAVFNQMSEDLGGFVETIAPGAFANSLATRDVRALFNHQSAIVLGRQAAGTLRLVEDEIGLAFEIDVPDTTAGRDLLVSMDRGDITQMSFGFVAIADTWENVAGRWVRTLLEVELHEVSPVTFPAYTQTTVSARSLDAWKAAQASIVPEPDPEAVADEMRRLRLRLLAH